MSAIAINIILKSTRANEPVVAVTPLPIVIMSEEVISQDNPEAYLRTFLTSPAAEGIKDMCAGFCKTVGDWLRCSVYCRVVDGGGTAKFHIPASSVFDLPLDTIRYAIQDIITSGDPSSAVSLNGSLESIKIPTNLNDRKKLKIERMLCSLHVEKAYPEFYSKCVDKLMFE